MDFNEFLKSVNYKENPIMGYDAWELAKFDRNKDGKINGSSGVVGTEAYDKKKYSNRNDLNVEYQAYVTSVETANAQRLRQLLAQWEAQTGQENYKAAQSEAKTRAERENELAEDRKKQNSKLITVAVVVLGGIAALKFL